MPGQLRWGSTVTPDRVREYGPSFRVAEQSPIVSGTSRSERPCDKHTLFERIGEVSGHPYGVRISIFTDATILNPDSRVPVHAPSYRASVIGSWQGGG